jgi:hypothetical protein
LKLEKKAIEEVIIERDKSRVKNKEKPTGLL